MSDKLPMEKLSRVVESLAKSIMQETGLCMWEAKIDVESEERGYFNTETGEREVKHNRVLTITVTCSEDMEDAMFQAQIASHTDPEKAVVQVTTEDPIEDVDDFLERVLGRDGGMND